MKEVFKNLFCGDEGSWLNLSKVRAPNISFDQPDHPWAVIHACKEPFHRFFVGYAGRGCPKDSPEYLWALRGNRLALNIVDAPKPEYFDESMMDIALKYIEDKLSQGLKVLVHCNQGESRSPSICVLYLIKHGIIKGETFEDCEAEFMKVYPAYNPGPGIRLFAKDYWMGYKGNT